MISASVTWRCFNARFSSFSTHCTRSISRPLLSLIAFSRSSANCCFLRHPSMICLKKKKALYLSVNVFSTKVLIGDTIFYVSNWRQDRHFTWSSEPHEGPAACSAKAVPSFLSYFKSLSISPAAGIEPATSRSAVKRSTD